MARVRISTTVDTERLDRARQIINGRDSEVIDRALSALIEDDERRREIAALTQSPYHLDSDLDLGSVNVGWDDDLPYDGEVPPEVEELARRRRSKAS
ncbi:MAG: hypothetical protein V9F03_14670 [Microthrixaceae bacterium]